MGALWALPARVLLICFEGSGEEDDAVRRSHKENGERQVELSG
jgi:hypothetical protein